MRRLSFIVEEIILVSVVNTEIEGSISILVQLSVCPINVNLSVSKEESFAGSDVVLFLSFSVAIKLGHRWNTRKCHFTSITHRRLKIRIQHAHDRVLCEHKALSPRCNGDTLSCAGFSDVSLNLFDPISSAIAAHNAPRPWCNGLSLCIERTKEYVAVF